MWTPPNPTPVYRIVHLANLPIFLQRGALYSPNQEPNDGLILKGIHNAVVQGARANQPVPCAGRGTCHDYVPFYFGRKSVMLFQLKTGWVPGHVGGQQPIIYLKTNAQLIAASGLVFAFTDGHGLAAFTSWFDDLGALGHVDWNMVNQTYWNDKPSDNDRQRRKQAEFMIQNSMPWYLVEEIVVLNQTAKTAVEQSLRAYPTQYHPPVFIRTDWYY